MCYIVSFKIFLLIIWESHTMYFDHIHLSLLPVTPPRSTPPSYWPSFVPSSFCLITHPLPTYSLVRGHQLESVTPTRDHTRKETHSLSFLDTISCPQLVINYRGLWTFPLFVLECWPAWSISAVKTLMFILHLSCTKLLPRTCVLHGELIRDGLLKIHFVCVFRTEIDFQYNHWKSSENLSI